MDRIPLNPPRPDEYRDWCVRFLSAFVSHYPVHARMLADDRDRVAVAAVLAEEFQQQKESERTLRIWIKLASFVVSVLFAACVTSQEELLALVRRTAREASGQILPWEEQ